MNSGIDDDTDGQFIDRAARVAFGKEASERVATPDAVRSLNPLGHAMTTEQAAAAKGEIMRSEMGDKDPDHDIRAFTALKNAGYTAPDHKRLILKVLERAFIDDEIAWRRGSFPDSGAFHQIEKGDIFQAMIALVQESYTKEGQPIGEQVARQFVMDFTRKADAIVSRHHVEARETSTAAAR